LVPGRTRWWCAAAASRATARRRRPRNPERGHARRNRRPAFAARDRAGASVALREVRGMYYDKPSLQGQHLSRTYGQGAAATRALREVSLEFYPGQLTVLMGPSGSGKSTLLAVLSGLLKPDSGRVVALGQDLYRLDERCREEFRRRHCGFIFQG